MTIEEFMKDRLYLFENSPKFSQKIRDYKMVDTNPDHSRMFWLHDGTRITQKNYVNTTYRTTLITKPLPEFMYATRIDRSRSGRITDMTLEFDNGTFQFSYNQYGAFSRFRYIQYPPATSKYYGAIDIFPTFTSVDHRTLDFFKGLGYDMKKPYWWFTLKDEDRVMYIFERQLW